VKVARGAPAAAAVAEPGDVPAIRAVLRAAYAPFASSFAPSALLQDEGRIRADLASWLVVRRSGEGVVACVLHGPEDDFHTCSYLATAPGHRRQGHGSALLEEVKRRAAHAGRADVRVALRRSLHANIMFFTARGFTRFAPFGTGEHDLYRWTGGGS
jgi:GNAT superfamily N-acetyltransferase